MKELGPKIPLTLKQHGFGKQNDIDKQFNNLILIAETLTQVNSISNEHNY